MGCPRGLTGMNMHDTRSKDATNGAPGLTTRSKKLRTGLLALLLGARSYERGSWHRYERSKGRQCNPGVATDLANSKRFRPQSHRQPTWKGQPKNSHKCLAAAVAVIPYNPHKAWLGCGQLSQPRKLQVPVTGDRWFVVVSGVCCLLGMSAAGFFACFFVA